MGTGFDFVGFATIFFDKVSSWPISCKKNIEASPPLPLSSFLSINNFQKGELKGDFGFIFLPGKATALSGNLQPEKLLDI